MQKLNMSEFKLAEFIRSTWCIYLKVGQDRKDLLKPEFWSHVAARVKRNDHIEVLHDDGNYYAQLIVLSSDKVGVKVAFLNEVNLRELESTVVDHAEFYTKFRGPRRWSIMRKSDNAMIEENIDTEGQANQRLRDMTTPAAA